MSSAVNLQKFACWLETRCLQKVREMNTATSLEEKLAIIDDAQYQISYLLLALKGNLRIEGVDLEALNEAKARLEKLGLYRK